MSSCASSPHGWFSMLNPELSLLHQLAAELGEVDLAAESDHELTQLEPGYADLEVALEAGVQLIRIHIPHCWKEWHTCLELRWLAR